MFGLNIFQSVIYVYFNQINWYMINFCENLSCKNT